MKDVILVSNKESLRNSIERYFELNTQYRTHFFHVDISNRSFEDGWVCRKFLHLSNLLDNTLQRYSGDILRGPLVFLDLNCFYPQENDEGSQLYSFTDPFDLDVLEGSYPHWKAVAGMLILAFPEVHWVFPCTSSPVDNNSLWRGSFDQAHLLTRSSLGEIVRLHEQKFCPLFDPTGLRNHLRRGLSSEDPEERETIPERQDTAAVFDDEVAYAHFNAYAAYRFGYRGWAVTSWALLKRLFGGNPISEDDESPGDPEWVWGDPVDLSLEDLYCPFPDRPYYVSLSDLDERKDWLPAIEEIENRAIITVGHHRDDEGKKRWGSNEKYLREWQEEKEERKATVVQKPLSGIFDLWRKAGFWEMDLWDWNGQPEAADSFQWPPDPEQEGENSGGHSAPGRLLLIAERLISRSKAVLKEAQSVSDATYAATLALEAKELIGNRTPTTSLEALALQHRAEVVAEGMFHGIEFHLDVENRFEDLKQEVEAIGRWFSGSRRKRVTLNGRLAIIEDLAREFSRLDQFEEERTCRAEARRLYFDFWAYQSPWRLPLLPVLRYLSFSLKSLPVFLGLVVFWILLFGIGYHVLDPVVHVKDLRGFGNAFSSSIVYFLTLAPPDPYWGEGVHRRVLWNSVTAFQSFISLSHLGLLVSHIYLIVSRR